MLVDRGSDGAKALLMAFALPERFTLRSVTCAALLACDGAQSDPARGDAGQVPDADAAVPHRLGSGGPCAHDEPDSAPPDDAASCDATTWFARVPDLRGCDLSGVDVRMVELIGGTSRGMRSFDLVGCSLVGTEFVTGGGDYRCVAQRNGLFALVGPGADLRGADLTEVDLGDAVLTRVRA